MLCLQKTFEGTNLPALVHKIVEGSFEPVKGQYSEGLKQLVIATQFSILIITRGVTIITHR